MEWRLHCWSSSAWAALVTAVTAGCLSLAAFLARVLSSRKARGVASIHEVCDDRRRKRLAVKVSSGYARDVILEAASNLGISEDSSAPCEWGDFALLDWDQLLAGEDSMRRCSSLYLRAALVRKGMLAHYLAKRRKDWVLPPSLVFDVEDEDDIEAMRSRIEAWGPSVAAVENNPAFVVKASNANRGEHLYLAQSANEVADVLRAPALEEGIVEWVVQRYVAPPLLLNGRKFHVRCHFLVSGCPYCGCSRAWLHESCHALLVASVAYRESDQQAETSDQKRLAHLTNHCVQVQNLDYEEEQQVFLLCELDAATGRLGLAGDILLQLKVALSAALETVSSVPAGFAPLPQSFELFGADFAIEDGRDGVKAYLLEVNAGPDLSVFGERLRSHCVQLVQDVLAVAVLPFLGEAPARHFQEQSSCRCRLATTRTGFTQELWTFPPRTDSASEELQKFKRRVGVAGRWVKALHESSGVEVRGVQSNSNDA